MGKWIEAGDVQEFPAESKSCVEVSGFSLVICHVKGALHAAANICPHAGLPLGDGDMTGTLLTCPYHGYTYDMTTGRNFDDPHDALLIMFPIRVQDGRVEVNLPLADE